MGARSPRPRRGECRRGGANGVGAPHDPTKPRTSMSMGRGARAERQSLSYPDLLLDQAIERFAELGGARGWGGWLPSRACWFGSCRCRRP